MAVTQSVPTSTVHSTSGAETSLATASFAIPAAGGNDVILAFIATRADYDNDVTSVSDVLSGSAWTRRAECTSTYGSVHGWIYERTAGAGGSAVVTAAMSGLYTPILGILKLTGDGALSFVRALDDPGTFHSTVTALTVDCSSRDLGDAIVALMAMNAVKSSTPGSGWTEAIDYSSPYASMAAQLHPTGADTATFTVSPAESGIGVAVEYSEAAGGVDVSLGVVTASATPTTVTPSVAGGVDVTLTALAAGATVAALAKEPRALLPVVSVTGDPGGTIGILHILNAIIAGATLQALTAETSAVNVSLGVVTGTGTMQAMGVAERALVSPIQAGATLQVLTKESRSLLPAVTATGDPGGAIDILHTLAPIMAGASMQELVVAASVDVSLGTVTGAASMQAIGIEPRALVAAISAGATVVSLIPYEGELILCSSLSGDILDSFLAGVDPADDGAALGSGLYSALGQSFLTPAPVVGPGIAVCMALSKYGSPTGQLIVRIYATTGTHGVDAIPTGIALATSEAIDVSILGPYLTGWTWVGFPLLSFTPRPATVYAWSAEYDGGDANNYVAVGNKLGPSGEAVHAGNASAYDTQWRRILSTDRMFSVKGPIGTVLYPIISLTGPALLESMFGKAIPE